MPAYKYKLSFEGNRVAFRIASPADVTVFHLKVIENVDFDRSN